MRLVVRAHLQDADIECPGAACEFAAHVDALRPAPGIAADMAGKERRDRTPGHSSEIEVARSFEKEIPLLLEEQRKAREIHAALVDLGLGEVGVDAQIQLHRGCDVVERVEPDIAVGNCGRLPAPGRRQMPDGVGLQVEAESLREIAQPLDAPGVDDAGEPLIERVARPEALFILATDRAPEVDAPAVRVGIEVQRPKGISISALHPVSVRRTRAVQIPSHERLICRPRRLPAATTTAAATSTATATSAGQRHKPVAHRAGRIDLEKVPGAPVEEAVDNPRKAVVGIELSVALHLVVQHGVRLAVVENDAEHNTAGLIDDAHVGGLGRRHSGRSALEQPARGAARCHTGSSSTPSIWRCSSDPTRTAVTVRTSDASPASCAMADVGLRVQQNKHQSS